MNLTTKLATACLLILTLVLPSVSADDADPVAAPCPPRPEAHLPMDWAWQVADTVDDPPVSGAYYKASFAWTVYYEQGEYGCTFVRSVCVLTVSDGSTITRINEGGTVVVTGLYKGVIPVTQNLLNGNGGMGCAEPGVDVYIAGAVHLTGGPA